MTIIAMGREMGSRGKDVAQHVADSIGASLIHYELIDHLADRTRLRKSHVVRFLEDGEDMLRALTPEETLPAILSATEILDIASIPESVVMRGWGGVALLRAVPHVVRVRITAPLEVRVANLGARLVQPDETRIREEIALFDEAHAAIMNRHFGFDYDDPALYDLVLDTSELQPDQCAQCIVDFTNDKRFIGWAASLSESPTCSCCGHMGFAPRLDNKSRMSREIPVRFCEGLGVRFPRATRLLVFTKTEKAAQRARES